MGVGRGNGPYSVYNLVFDESNQPHVFSLYNMSLSSDEARKKYGYPTPDGNPKLGYDFRGIRDYYAYVKSLENVSDVPLVIKAKGSSRAIRRWNTNLSQLL